MADGQYKKCTAALLTNNRTAAVLHILTFNVCSTKGIKRARNFLIFDMWCTLAAHLRFLCQAYRRHALPDIFVARSPFDHF